MSCAGYPSMRLPLMVLVAVAAFASGCPRDDGTALLTVSFDDDLDVQQLRISAEPTDSSDSPRVKLSPPEPEPSGLKSGATWRLFLPTAWDGKEVAIEVVGLHQDQPVAHGTARIKIDGGREQPVAVTLQACDGNETGPCEPPIKPDAPPGDTDDGGPPDQGPDAELPPCGNGTCAPDEDCVSCPIDCDRCPVEWTPLTPLPPESNTDLNAVHFPINALVGFAVGSAGTVVKTTDAGASWVVLDSKTTATLRGVFFVDEQTGYAVGDAGVFIKTADGGASWDTGLTLGTTATLHDVAFTDAEVGYVVGNGGVLLKTLNGGANWTPLNSKTTEPLYAVHFVDARTGFVVGGGGVVLQTSDAGARWTVRGSGVATQTLRGVAFSADGRTGYAVGDAGTVIKSQTDGTSWTYLGSPTLANLWAVDFPVDDLHGHAVGEGGVLLRTVDGGVNWQREDARTEADLRDVVFPAYWTVGYTVGAAAAAAKRVPLWSTTVVYDTTVSNLAAPTLSEGDVFVVNGAGYLFAIRPADRIALYKPVLLDDVALRRAPVGPLAPGADPTIFAATRGGTGYAINSTNGAILWQTDANAQTTAVEPLGDALIASPVASPSRNIAYFATRNLAGKENRVFAFDLETGACKWVFNGDCDGGTGTGKLGEISEAPIHDGLFERRIYFTSTSLDGGATVWAVDAGDTTPGAIVWSHDLGSSRAAPQFAPTDPSNFATLMRSLLIGTEQGRVYRLQTNDEGTSCWTENGSGCGDPSGSDEAFCTATDRRSTSCPAGPAISLGFFMFTLSDDVVGVVFATADDHLRMIDGDGQLRWKTATPIAGASFPLVRAELGAVFVGSSDGNLYQLDLTDGSVTAKQQVGDGRATVGSPSYYDDRGPADADAIFVATGFGLLHGFELPLQ